MTRVTSLLFLSLFVVLAAGCSDDDSPVGPGDGGHEDDGGDGGPEPSPACGNGLVDGAEECERLVGCGAEERCTALCACELMPTSPPSSQDLIARALADGVIDYATSLQYRVWALFQAPELPEAYDGEGSVGEDTQLFLELSHARATLPVEIEAAIAPYLARPDDPASIYSQPPFFPHGGAAGPTNVGCAPNADGAPDWRPTETTHFVVWSCGGGVNGMDSLATARGVTAAVLEQVWSAMVPELSAPRPDNYAAGPAPWSRTDVYILVPNQCRVRNGGCAMIRGTALAAAAPDVPCSFDRGALSSSAYLIVGAAQVPAAAPEAGTASPFRYILAHELFHAISFKLNLEAQGGTCFPDPGFAPAELGSWLTEASAEWAAYAYFSDDFPARRTQLFSNFQTLRDNSRVGLHSTVELDPYEASLYPLFVQEETGGRARMVELWTGSQGATTRAHLDDRLNLLFDFAEHFRDFSVRNFNRDLPGSPIPFLHAGFDEALPVGDAYAPILIEPAITLAAPIRDIPTTLRIAPLASVIEQYKLDPSTRSFRVDARGVGNAGHLSLDALVQDTTWSRVSPPGPVYEFCREVLGQDIDELYLIYSNFDRSRSGAIEGDALITTRTFCPGGWSGTIRLVQTVEEHSEESGPAGTTVADRYERDEQRWTIGATRLDLPEGFPPGFEVETIDTTWNGELTVDATSTFTDTDCGVSVSREHGSGSGTSDTSFFASSGAPGVYGLQTTEGAADYTVPIEYSDQPCEGPASSSPGERTSAEGHIYFTIIPELAQLTENPPGSGHFVGTGTFLHDVQPLPGGEQVIDITAYWDLTRTPLHEGE